MDLPQNLSRQRETWIAQRIGWGAIAALLSAALLGAFGEGPLSHAQATTPSGELVARYEKFCRQGTPTQLELRIHAPPDAQGHARSIRLDSALLNRTDVLACDPAPTRQSCIDGDRLYFFDDAPPHEIQVRLTLLARQWGAVRGAVSLSAGDFLEVHQFVYP